MENSVVPLHIYTGRGIAMIYLHDKQDEITTRISKKEKKMEWLENCYDYYKTGRRKLLNDRVLLNQLR